MNSPEARVITREDLASLLERSSDPLAPSARASLGSPDAPESAPVWTSSRSDLLATYEVRLAVSENGEGPATVRMREYTEMLRDAKTPDTLGEIGWSSGDTFYVVLIHQSEILAVSSVARAVWYIGEQSTSLDHGTLRRVDIKTFGIGDGFNDVTLIKNTLDQGAYVDSDAEVSPELRHGAVHGPYRLAAIDPHAFTPVSAGEAKSLLRAWVTGAEADGQPTPAGLLSNVYALLDAADAVYRFPVLAEESSHEYGPVVGSAGFHEFITIERIGHRLNVIVASDH
jgi:hypothetical protein